VKPAGCRKPPVTTMTFGLVSIEHEKGRESPAFDQHVPGRFVPGLLSSVS
jgi:hypothetical protein